MQSTAMMTDKKVKYENQSAQLTGNRIAIGNNVAWMSFCRPHPALSRQHALGETLMLKHKFTTPVQAAKILRKHGTANAK
ncbi:hypothetical protein T06_11293 [Trichinella sp. T6]|nr:hypothetical protein T06_11293 [Trichinella sp. T6]